MEEKAAFEAGEWDAEMEKWAAERAKWLADKAAWEAAWDAEGLAASEKQKGETKMETKTYKIAWWRKPDLGEIGPQLIEETIQSETKKRAMEYAKSKAAPENWRIMDIQTMP